jgi:uncharacterized membrane protein
MSSPSSSRRTATVLAALAGPFRWLAQHRILCLILFSSFVARMLLAGWNSYWFDEILSVARYGTDNDTIVSALKTLAQHSSHPPLYHIILFFWMKLFGDAEIATRTLSNLYVTGATLCLYILALKLFGRRVAIASALLFAFSYAAFRFGAEVRSYPQSLFLVTLSSLLLLRWLEQIKPNPRWRDFFNGRGIGLFLCNVALLLTHYSNALFLLVQVLFAAVVLWHRSRPASALSPVKAALFYALQFVAALAAWGPVAFSTGARFQKSTKFSISTLPTKDPISVLLEYVVEKNFKLPALVYAILSVLLVLVLIRTAIRYFVRSGKPAPLNAYFVFYLTAWAILPLVFVYITFFALGAERYMGRYFAFCFPPLPILLVLAIEQAVESLNVARPWLRFSLSRHYLRYALLYALAICAVFALPRAYAGAISVKEPYRDIARSIVKLVEGKTDASFAVYEASHTTHPMLDFYMKRMSKRVRLIGTIGVDKDGRDPLAGVDAVMSGKDYLVIAFTHKKPKHFPLMMRQLSKEYDLVASQLLRSGRGYMMWTKRAADRAR